MSNWYCNECKTIVEPSHVTYDERHDERCGGCGNHVGEKTAQIEAIAELAIETLEHIDSAKGESGIYCQTVARMALEKIAIIGRP